MLQNTKALDLMLEDLKKSNLQPEDLSARIMDAPEKAITKTSAVIEGYVIPYFNIRGALIPFYRVRLFESDIKYKQPKETPTTLYFPKNFASTFTSLPQNARYVILTEGEKKATLATKLGFPTVALGGVDAWRNRQIILPSETEFSQEKKATKVKLPPQSHGFEDYTSGLADGMQDLIDLLIHYQAHIVIIYDTDAELGVKPQIQRAAAALGFDLRFRGIPFRNIRQAYLPPPDPPTPESKTGLDDFLTIDTNIPIFQEILTKTLTRRSAFPRHPNVRDYISKRLQKPVLDRRTLQSISLAVLSDLDSRGLRLRNADDPEGESFYFDYSQRKLLKFELRGGNAHNVNNSPFGSYLYNQFGISGVDEKLVSWIGTQFVGEQPIELVTPYRIFARPKLDDQRVYFQISDGQYITISGSSVTSLKDLPGIEVHDNGEQEVLFEADQVSPLDLKTLLTEYIKQSQEAIPAGGWWSTILDDVRLRDHDKHKKMLALLYYISPWLYRWRGLQLPLEMILGEPGSGKSTLCELRQSIISGLPKLRNAPQDLRDWQASVANAGGLHVTDNVQMVDRQLRNKLSDELCRIITEPNPIIEMRRLYTNSDVARVPVKLVFALTALSQPFNNADIIQRSVITDLDKTGAVTYDSNWTQHQLARFGGREAWVAHHLYVLHKFLGLAQAKWDPNYKAKHRLIHFEQVMMLMAEILNIQEAKEWLPDYLSNLSSTAIVEADWAFEGLQTFANYVREIKETERFWTVQDMCNYFGSMPEFEKNEFLINGRRLGRYIQGHKNMLEVIVGIRQDGTINNRIRFSVSPTPPRPL